MGRDDSRRTIRIRGDSPVDGDAGLNAALETEIRSHWWAAVASVTRLVGDLTTAEDAVQEACAVAVEQWAASGVPANPRAWLVGVARHKALDALRRDTQRRVKEARVVRERPLVPDAADLSGPGDDQLALVFMCCHPALDASVHIPLTLRSVCGLTTAEIAAAFVVSEPTMTQRLVRAKRKIRQAGIPLSLPADDAVAPRLSAVLRVIYLLINEGHRPSKQDAVVRGPLLTEAIHLSRALVDILPDEPEIKGLLALALLTDARRLARVAANGVPVLLADQDRSLWDRDSIRDGLDLIEEALRQRRPGPYQLQAAIAACHASASSIDTTDWRQIVLLYDELLRYEPNPIVLANRAIALAEADGPAAGLAILDQLSTHPQLLRWPPLHIARARLLSRLDRQSDAIAAYQVALELEPAPTERAFISIQLGDSRSESAAVRADVPNYTTNTAVRQISEIVHPR